MSNKLKYYYRDLPPPVENVSVFEFRWEDNQVINCEIFYANLDINGKLKSSVFSKTSKSDLNKADSDVLSYLGRDNYKTEVEKEFDTITENIKKEVNNKFVNPEMYKEGEYAFLFSEARLPWIISYISEIWKYYYTFHLLIDKIYEHTKCKIFKDEVDRYKKIRLLIKIEGSDSEILK